MPSRTGRIKRMARHHENLSPLGDGQAGRDQRAGAMARFDDHDPLAEPAHNAVSGGKTVRTSTHRGRKLTDHGAPLQNRLGQGAVGRRIDAPMTTSKHR